MIIIGLQYKNNESEINLDNPFNCLYCLVLAVWSTVLIEVWKRKENEIAHIWNMTDYKGDDAELPDYRAEYVINAR